MKFFLDAISVPALNRLKIMQSMFKQGLWKGSLQAGKSLQRTTRKEIDSGVKTGKLYWVNKGGRRRRHRASAAGETHARITGRLTRAVSYRSTSTQIKFGYGIGQGRPAPEYGAALEYGIGVDARPSIKNGINADQKNTIKHLENQINKMLKSRK